MTNSELELWNKIREFQFDKPNVRLTFAKRLSRENEISEQFGQEIIDEYRKFIFLCCVSEKQVSPSHFVDLAWHLHLTYTRSYWIELCKNTIGRDLHHNPTEGGDEEDNKFKDLYQGTLDIYEHYFASIAPGAIWPKENSEPGKTVRNERSRYWVIPKPAFGFRGKKNSIALLAIILSGLLLGCTGSISIVLVLLLLIGVVFFLVWRNNNRGTNGDGGSGCGSSGCGSIFGSSDSEDSGDSGGSDSGCSSGCSGGCGGGGD